MDPELTLEEMLADPIIQLVMKRDNVVADDVRRVIHKARKAHRRRDLLVERHTGTLPDRAANRLMLKATTDFLLVLARSNTVQKNVHGGSDHLLRFLVRWRRAEPKDDLQVKIVADHADEVSGQAVAIMRPNFLSLIGDFQDLGEPGRATPRSLLVKRLHKIREAIGLGDSNSVNADQGGRQVEGHEMPTKRCQRLPQIVAFDLLNYQGRKHFVRAFLDDGRKQALLVAELIVNVAFRPASAGDDRVDACRRIALFEKNLGSRLKKGLSAAFVPPCRCCSHSLSPITMHPLTGNVRYHICQW